VISVGLSGARRSIHVMWWGFWARALCNFCTGWQTLGFQLGTTKTITSPRQNPHLILMYVFSIGLGFRLTFVLGLVTLPESLTYTQVAAIYIYEEPL